MNCDYVARLVWERCRILLEELEKVFGDWNVWLSFLFAAILYFHQNIYTCVKI